MSYSLYLWHWPILAYLHYLFGYTLTMEMKIGAVVATAFFSYLSLHFIETPFRRAGSQLAGWKVVGVAVGTPLLLVVGAFVIRLGEGLPFRIQPSLVAAVKKEVLDRKFLSDKSKPMVPIGAVRKEAEVRQEDFLFLG